MNFKKGPQPSDPYRLTTLLDSRSRLIHNEPSLGSRERPSIKSIQNSPIKVIRKSPLKNGSEGGRFVKRASRVAGFRRLRLDVFKKQGKRPKSAEKLNFENS